MKLRLQRSGTGCWYDTEGSLVYESDAELLDFMNWLPEGAKVTIDAVDVFIPGLRDDWLDDEEDEEEDDY